MALMSLSYYHGEIRAGLKLRNHPNLILRRRNRARVRLAISRIRAGDYYIVGYSVGVTGN